MPHFTLNVGQLGPLVSCAVRASQERVAALRKAGRPVPAPITVQALVDTGASCTCVDPSVLRLLDIPPTGRMQVYTPSTREATPHETDQYDVSILIPGATADARPFALPSLAVIESELQHQGRAIRY